VDHNHARRCPLEQCQLVTTPKRDPVKVDEPLEPSRPGLPPTSILGIAALVLAFAVCAAFNGAILYS